MIQKILSKNQPKKQLNDSAESSNSGTTFVRKWLSGQSDNRLRVNESSGESDCSKSNAILAFRTITTMLSLISSPTKVTITGQKNISDAERHELRVLDALSSVVVRKYEIAAVVAKRYDGANIEILASVNLENPHINPQQHQHTERSWNPLRLFMVSPNPRDPARNPKDKIDSMTTRNTLPTLVDPDIGISEALSMAQPENLLKTFLETQWWVFKFW